MSQQTKTEKNQPDGRMHTSFHLDDETIPPEQMKERLKGTESAWAAAKGRETERSGEITSKTKISVPETEPETPFAESRREKENPPETEPEVTKEKAESPSAETLAKEETPLSENSEKSTAELQKGTEPARETAEGEKTATDSGTEKTMNSILSEDSENSPRWPESILEDNISSLTNISTEEIGAAIEELQRRAEDAVKKANSLLLMDNLLKAVNLHNRLVAEQTERLSAFKKELSVESAKQKTELEGEMRELRQGLAAAIHTYSECLSLKTSAIYTGMEESLDRLEMNNRWIREASDRLIEEDRTVIFKIPALVEEEMTRAANETSDYFEGALKETVGKYTNEIKASTKFLRKQVEERKKASRFEKVTDVLMRVFCPILALGTFVLACVVTCFV